MLKSLISLMRPRQWVKNLFVFLPMFFGGALLNVSCWTADLLCFIAFSLMASAVYCINDVRDAESDRMHPVKCRRPVASGRVSAATATALGVALAAGSLAVSFLALPHAALTCSLVLITYLALNLIYSLGLKDIGIVDVCILALGFVLRVLVGGMAASIVLSPWIVLMTFLLAMFLALAKRRDDLLLMSQGTFEGRPSISNYNMPFMDMSLAVTGAVTIVCYIMYTLSPALENRLGSNYVYITSIFVVAGILRYLQIAMVEHRSGNPTSIMLHDKFIGMCMAGWILVFIFILYL